MGKIKTLGNTIGGGKYAAEKQLAIAWPRHPSAPQSSLVGLPKAVPVDVAPKPTVTAQVNHGRWLANCPFCPGAEMVDPDDPRFFCMSCDNDVVGGKWLRVAFPDERGEIEELLEVRPTPNQNWSPLEKETPATLRRDNELMLKRLIVPGK